MEDTMKEVSAIDALKEAVESQGTINLHDKRVFEEAMKSGGEKRLKTGVEVHTPIKEAALSALADTAQSPNSMTLASSFPFQYGFSPMSALNYAIPQGGVTVLEPEHYQQFLMQQQQIRYMEQGMREMVRSQEEEGAGPKKRRSKSAIPTISQTQVAYASSQYTGRFMLLEQPNVRQRKSYKNENRYILPNPLTICAREDSPTGEKLPRILEGEVTISLVNADGQELPAIKANILESPEGGLTQQLDSNLSAHFSLKILDTSEGTMFRLLFTINFSLEAIGPCEEKVLSRPFQVYSNRKKNTKGQERPTVIDIKPKEGISTQETEIWIKGRGFSDRVVVTFGDKMGRIVETTENLLTVCAPSRYDLVADTPVQVIVSNKYPHETLTAEKKLTFIYYAG